MATIFELIDSGDAAGVHALLAADPATAAARDDQGLSPLMRAFYRGGAGDVFQAIAAAGPPLDGWDRLLLGRSDELPAPAERSLDGFTPLHIAVFARNADAVRALLAAGADPNELATASFALVTPLGTAATFGVTDLAKLLLDHGADPERTSDHGHTPLHAAAANGNLRLVELLLARGADPDARTSDGRTPADLAADESVRGLLQPS